MSAVDSSAFFPAVVPLPVDGARGRLGRDKVEADGGRAVEWVLKRNCSLAPSQTLLAFGAVSLTALIIAVGFAWVGAPIVSAFAGLELAALGVAWLVWARHATDRDTVTLRDVSVTIVCERGTRVSCVEWPRAWLRVSPHGSGAALQSMRERVVVGAHTPRACVQAFTHELRQALRAPAHPSTQT